MEHSLVAVKARLLEERLQAAQAARSSPFYFATLTVAWLLFALAPLVPGAGVMLGALSVSHTLPIVALVLASSYVRLWLFRRRGLASRAYLAAEAAETFLVYAAILAFILLSNVTWSALWVLCPFTARYWSQLNPFHPRSYGAILFVSHALLALAYLVQGKVDGAILGMAVGFFAAALYELSARACRSDLAVRAESQVLRSQVNAARLEQERVLVAQSLRARIEKDLAAIVAELELESAHAGPPELTGEMAKQARALAAAVGGIGQSLGATQAPCSLTELAERLDEKCRPLCAEATYALRVVGAGQAQVSGLAVAASVRIGQELVRNAVTHGAATDISVELENVGTALTLTVRDNGVGLNAASFARATGGLHNARHWLMEQGAALELLGDGSSPGTALRAQFPSACTPPPRDGQSDAALVQGTPPSRPLQSETAV